MVEERSQRFFVTILRFCVNENINPDGSRMLASPTTTTKPSKTKNIKQLPK